MSLDEFIQKLQELKQHSDVSGVDSVVISKEGHRFDIEIVIDPESSDILLKPGEEK